MPGAVTGYRSVQLYIARIEFQSVKKGPDLQPYLRNFWYLYRICEYVQVPGVGREVRAEEERSKVTASGRGKVKGDS